tara:strand:- start:285 stop:458 length:174 start_codon:yes stop_codon:yes gene_type:complete
LEKFHNRGNSSVNIYKDEDTKAKEKYETDDHPQQFIYIENNYISNNNNLNDSTQIID